MAYSVIQVSCVTALVFLCFMLANLIFSQRSTKFQFSQVILMFKKMHTLFIFPHRKEIVPGINSLHSQNFHQLNLQVLCSYSFLPDVSLMFSRRVFCI